MAGLKVFIGRNFISEGVKEFPSDNTGYLQRQDVLFDERTNFLADNVDLSNWDWYFNYINFNYIEAKANTDSRAQYLLDLGYVPVVYMPTCAEKIGVKLFEIMDAKHIPYIRITATSFTRKYFDSQMIDGWISKMDAAKLLGCRPEEVTSEKVVRGLILNA